MRRRQTAMILTLALLLELALLLCACGHLCGHDCPPGETCAICQYARSGLRAGFLPVLMLLSFFLCIHHYFRRTALARAFGLPSLVAEKVRLND